MVGLRSAPPSLPNWSTVIARTNVAAKIKDVLWLTTDFRPSTASAVGDLELGDRRPQVGGEGVELGGGGGGLAGAHGVLPGDVGDLGHRRDDLVGGGALLLGGDADLLGGGRGLVHHPGDPLKSVLDAAGDAEVRPEHVPRLRRASASASTATTRRSSRRRAASGSRRPTRPAWAPSRPASPTRPGGTRVALPPHAVRDRAHPPVGLEHARLRRPRRRHGDAVLVQPTRPAGPRPGREQRPVTTLGAAPDTAASSAR